MTGPLFPGNYSQIWIRGRFITMDGQPVRGKLSLFPTVTGGALVNRSAKLIMSSALFSADTGNDGYVAVQVPATNDPDLTPINFTYSVTTPIGQMFSIVVPYDTAPLNSVGDPLHGQPVIELIDVVPVGSSGGVGQLLRGIGIQSMVDNGAGGLLITYSDGSTTTIAMPATVAGPAGPTGPQGPLGPVGPTGPAGGGATKLTDLTDVTTTSAAVGKVVAATAVTGGVPTAFGLVSSPDSLDRFYAPSAQLSFTQVGTVAYVPTSIGTDGLAYGALSESSSVLIRSSDGFATIDTGADLAAAGAPDPVIWAGRVAEGYIAVTSNGGGGNGTRGAMWFSTSWTSGWVKKQDLTAGLGTARIAVGRPEWDTATGATIWGVGEYTQQAGADHHLWVSRDGGQTWIDSFNRVAVDAANNNHMHAWAYDPEIRRMWLSHGDGRNSYFAYSDDLGFAWTTIPAYGMPVATVSPATSWHQPPILIAGEKYLITCPDAGDTGTNQSAVWAVDKSPAGAVTEALRVANVDGYRQYAASPYAMSSDRRRIYMLFPQSPTLGTTNQVYVAASADGGRSWAKVYTGASVLGDEYLTGIVGPDAAGRLFLSPKPNGAGARILLRATEPTWVSTFVGQRTTGISDLKAALVQAGIVAGGSASPLDLQGGRVTAGHASLNGQNGQLTLGQGSGDVGVVDTRSGTTQLRLRVAGAELMRLDANSVYIPTGKALKFAVSGTASILTGGNGSPEGATTASPGSLYLRFDGGTGTSLYVKETGTGTTGWVAK